MNGQDGVWKETNKSITVQDDGTVNFRLEEDEYKRLEYEENNILPANCIVYFELNDPGQSVNVEIKHKKPVLFNK